MERQLIDFIQRYYVIEKRGNDVFLRDIFESGQKDLDKIEITPKVLFFWGRAKNVTGVNLYSKDYTYIKKIIREVFREKNTIEFYEFLIKDFTDVIIPIREIKHEFPNLYGEQLQRIISENTSDPEV